jgi:uncharacterized protein (UPF0333 family)
MNTITVSCTYYADSYDNIALPEKYTEEDIEDYFVKYGQLTITFKDNFIWTYELSHPEVTDPSPLDIEVS